MRETWVRSLGWEDPLEKEMATHSSSLAWRIPWTEEPGGLQSTRGKELDTTERLHFLSLSLWNADFPGGTSGKEPSCQCKRRKRLGFSLWVGKMPWRSKRQPTPVFLPGESHGQRSLVGYNPWGRRVRHDWSNLARMHGAVLKQDVCLFLFLKL